MTAKSADQSGTPLLPSTVKKEAAYLAWLNPSINLRCHNSSNRHAIWSSRTKPRTITDKKTQGWATQDSFQKKRIFYHISERLKSWHNLSDSNKA